MTAAAEHGRRARLHRWRWRGAAFVAGGAAVLLAMGVGALTVIEFGLYDTASTVPHPKLVSWALHTTFKRSVALRAQGTAAPHAFTPAQVDAGFQQYVADCEMCHGGPGVSRAVWVRGLTPTPPFLLDTAYRFTPAQLDWILERGVKMSAMPSWGETRSHDQIWSIVAFLEALPNISPAQYARMRQSLGANAEPAAPAVQREHRPPNPPDSFSHGMRSKTA